MTTDEMAVYIGERLDLLREWDTCFTEWLSSLYGIHAVKQAMIKKGFGVTIKNNPLIDGWYVDFHYNGRHEGYGDTEAEAVLNAAYTALKAEEDKANG